MVEKTPRRLVLQWLLFALSGCRPSSDFGGALVIGAISYDEGTEMIRRYDHFKQHLGQHLKTHVELEPVRSEVKALERIQSNDWSLVFAPPGIAAIAIAHHQYTPILPLQSASDLRAVFVVRRDSSIRNMRELANQRVALGQPGSATGYYFPLYNLYGLTLAQVLFAPTPQMVLDWVSQGKVVAGALSLADLNPGNPDNQTKFRVLFTDTHTVPAGAILISSNVEQIRQEKIRKTLTDAPISTVREVGYVPNAPVPDYQYMNDVIERVRTIANHVQQQPARLF